MTTTITTSRQRLQLPLPQRNWRPKFPGDDLNETVYMLEDFLGGNILGTVNPAQWNNGGTGGSGFLASDLSLDNTNGVWVLTCASSTKTTERWLNMASMMFDGRQNITITWRCKISATTNTLCEAGMSINSAGGTGLDPDRMDCICWLYDTSVNPSTNWQVLARWNYNTTYVDTGVAADTNWHEFGLTITTSLVIPTLDGVPFAPITTNTPVSATAPEGSLAPYIFITNIGKNERRLFADYCEVYCAREI
jgi:hypothetical protein